MIKLRSSMGHVDIPNELVEALARTQLTGRESRVLWVLWRLSWGCRQGEAKITHAIFSKLTGLDMRHVARILRKLILRRIIVAKKIGRRVMIYSFEKDPGKWKTVSEEDLHKSPRGVWGGYNSGDDLVRSLEETPGGEVFEKVTSLLEDSET